MKRLLWLASIVTLVGCTGQGSKIEDGFLGGVSMSTSQSLVSADATAVSPGDSMTVRLQVRDASGNAFYVPDSSPVVTFSTSGGTSTGTFSSVNDLGNGTFTSTFTATGSGTATHIRATYNGTLISSYVSVTVAGLNTFTMNIPFTAGSDSDYILSDSTRMELSGGVVKLTAASQTDDDDSSTKWGDASVTKTGVMWDSTNNYIRLNTSTNNSDLDSSWTPEWSSLAGYWKMNNDWKDSVSTNDGTVHASPTFVAAKIGSYGASFSGTSGEYVSTAFTPAATGTIAMWFKLTSGYNSATGDKRLITCNRNSIGVNWGAPTPAVGSNNGAIDFIISPSAGNYSDLETTQANWLAGTWYHLVATWDGTNQKVYINGLLDKSISQTKTGGWGACNFPDSTRAFAGQMDDLAIWSGKALTLSQVQLLYARQSAKYSGQITSRVMDSFLTTPSWTSFSASTTLPFYKEMPGSAGSETSTDYSSVGGSLMTNLVGLWHLNETSGTSYADASSSGATGTGFGTLASVKGPLGNALKFDGSTSSYISAPWNLVSGNASRTMSVWFKTSSTADSLFMSWGTNNTNQLSQLGIYSGRIGLTCYGNDLTIPVSNADYANNQWHHILVTFNGSTRKLFLDGSLAASDSSSLNTGTSDINIGRGIAAAYYLTGSLDEAAVWSRALTDGTGGTPNEVLEVYRRGANRIKYQVRSCANSDCSDQDALSGLGWKGPDNSNLTYFRELNNNTSINSSGDAVGNVKTGHLDLSFSAFSAITPTPVSIASTRFIQYRAILESDEQNSLCSYGNCSPELKSASLGPNHYDTTVQTIVSKASLGAAYATLDTNGFTETGGSCSQGLNYALSANGTDFYYWNNTAWATSSDYSTASDAATIRAHIDSFPTSPAGTGTLQIKTFLKSDGTSSCEVDNLQVTGKHL